MNTRHSTTARVASFCAATLALAAALPAVAAADTLATDTLPAAHTPATEAHEPQPDCTSTRPFCDGWYTQLSLDLTLQAPYGSPAGSRFTDGRTQGLVAAVGRWFTPGLGMRFRLNWENGFPPLYNKKATWLNFLDPSDPNADHGGYITVVGDVPLDLIGLFGRYRADRRWRVQAFPRAGVAYNFGLKKGAPILGGGAGITCRLNQRWSLFGEAAYEMVASGFNGCPTNVGTGANGYYDVTLGVQYDLSKHGFYIKR